MIVGIAWIGASFYFNWLENRLNRAAPQEPGIAGNLWAVHGGGFYHLKKFEVAPDKLPANLHWFKWEAYTTWLSGMALLIVVYYLNSQAFMLDPGKSGLDSTLAIGFGVTSICLAWLVYDLLCKSPLKRLPLVLGLVIVALLALMAWQLDAAISSRAAYIHVGAAIGTIMVANVFFVIMPGQRELVNALEEGRQPDPEPGKNALLRSRHNNYFTLPVLFIMISNHFPSTYGHGEAWLVLLAVSLISVAVRHYFNIRHLHKAAIWVLPAAFAAMVGVMIYTAPKEFSNTRHVHVSDQDVSILVRQRCLSCHASQPTQPGFATAPAGIMLEDIEQIRLHARRIMTSAVITHTMPLGNLTGMTEQERAMLGVWLDGVIKEQEQ